MVVVVQSLVRETLHCICWCYLVLLLLLLSLQLLI